MGQIVLTWLGRIARFAGYLVVALIALVVFGALVPAIPLVGSIGSVFIAPFAPWIFILSLIGLAACAWRWRRTGGRVVLVMAGIAAFSVLGTAFIQSRQIAVARANGVNISVARIFSRGAERHKSPPARFLTYGSDGGKPLPIAVYAPAVGVGRLPAPVIVYVHGGGWGGGSLRDRASDMYWFADHGYLAISVEYSLSSAKRHTWDIVPPQIGCALNWIAGNAAKFGGDPSRMALFGESAGGNIVLDVSYMASAGALRPSCPGSPPRIGAIVAMYPIVDAVRMYGNKDMVAGPFARIMTTNYTGGTPQRYPDRYAAVSPTSFISRAAPPTLLMVGASDHLLPPAPARAFVARASAAGVDGHIIVVPYAEHSFDQSNGGVGSQLVRNATLKFLAEHGLAPR